MRTRILQSVIIGTTAALLYCTCVMGQDITFNSPAPWLTQRSDTIVVKAQLDTAKFKKKKISLAILKVENGKAATVASKTFKVNDITQDFTVGLAGTSLIGGRNFIRIEWSIPGETDKGFCAPLGIVNLNKISAAPQVHAARFSGDIEGTDMAGVIKDKQFVSVLNQQFSFLWTPKALVIVCKKTDSGDILKFAFDGKNGKNAFASYPDKMIDCAVKKDSLYMYSYQRAFQDSISYTPKPWINDISRISDKDFLMIKIPWYDIGLLPFDGRVLGFSAYAVSESGKPLGAFPEKASALCPGSWGSLVLDK